MNKSTLLLSTILACATILQQANATDIETNTARLQAMDKITGRVSEIDVPVNGLANFGTFSILVRKCVTKSPEETPENTAFVDIVDNYKTQAPVNIFKGWMFSSTPALSAVEHPIYDIWLLKCLNLPSGQGNKLSKEQLALRDTIPMIRPKASMPKAKIEVVAEPEEQVSIPETNSTANSDEQQPAEQAPIILNISETAQGEVDETLSEEEFASEGEEMVENLVAEPEEVITVTNETIAAETADTSSKTGTGI